ncbi:MAG: hypothetical protein NTY19_45455 [Planctomycetota bacterium]|nr:hypothetical protein [Planctomycetota bacterium]
MLLLEGKLYSQLLGRGKMDFLFSVRHPLLRVYLEELGESIF